MNLYKGKCIRLLNTNIYDTQYIKKPKDSIYNLTGNFYIFDDNIVNNRIRVSRYKDCSSIGWVNIYDIIDNESISIGSKVIIKGNIYQYADGSGECINNIDREMYVVDILESDEYDNTIGVSYEINSDRAGFININNIIKYIERNEEIK